ncbi:MAG TPA: hypothetical protein VIC83_04255 [Candidatus Limnocylindria bacterium]|jgi:hypothetical protein
MPEVSHVRLQVPEQATLNRILREGGAQAFPQWLYAEPGEETRLLWWGVREARTMGVAPAADDPRAALFPRMIDDWTDPPRALFLVTSDADRAQSDLEPIVGAAWHPAGDDAVLRATCRRIRLGRGELLLAQPDGDGYAADCLAAYGEGPIAVAIDGTTLGGRQVSTNPVTGSPAAWKRLALTPTTPLILFLPAAG